MPVGRAELYRGRAGRGPRWGVGRSGAIDRANGYFEAGILARSQAPIHTASKAVRPVRRIWPRPSCRTYNSRFPISWCRGVLEPAQKHGPANL